DLGFGDGSKQRSYFRKEPAISSGIAPWSASYWRLVDLNYFINLLQSLYRFIFQRNHFGPVRMFGKNRIQCFIDQRRLAAPAYSGHYNEFAQWKFYIHILQVISFGPFQFQEFSIAFSSLFWHSNTSVTIEITRCKCVQFQ